MSDETGSDDTGSGETWRRAEIESPCVKLCVVDARAGLCIGCYRSIAEITDWARMSAEARRALMADLPARAPLVAPARRGGRAGRRGD